MGLLDQLIGSVLGKDAQSQGGLGDLLSGLGGGGQQSGGGNTLAMLLPVVMALLQSRSAGGASGLEGLLGQLRAGGLEQQADSWVGTGANLPVSADELANVLGHERLSQLAAQAGVPEQQASAGLASLLPELVNQLTPQGQLPAESDVDDALGSLRRSLGI